MSRSEVPTQHPISPDLKRARDLHAQDVLASIRADHDAGAPAYALRLSVDDKTIVYSGDGAWSPDLGEAAADADLFIAEALFKDKQVPGHLDWRSLQAGLAEAPPKRLILTHFGPDMLSQLDSIAAEKAEDGMVITL